MYYKVKIAAVKHYDQTSGVITITDYNNVQYTFNNISQLEFIDAGIINFPTGDISSVGSDINGTYTSTSDFYDAIQNVIGEDVNSLYYPQRVSEGVEYLKQLSYKNFNSAFPSVYSSFINTAPFFSTNGGLPVLYFPGLKCIIFDGIGYNVLCSVDSSGDCKYVSNIGSGSGSTNFLLSTCSGYWCSCYGIVIFDNRYTFNEENAKDSSKWFSLEIQSANDGRMYVSIFRGSRGVEKLFSEFIPPDWNEPEDPFGPGGTSGPGDNPPGTFDDTSDPIPDSPLPTLSMADTGFTRIYNPTLSQVQSLAEYMWKTENIFETLWNKVKQSFENPMDVMIAFNIVPVAVPDGGTADFSIMYIPTGVQLTKAANQFVDVDCGTLELKGYYGSALDYSPNTRIQCFLPFIGMIELNPDEVMNTTLQVKYRVDIVSGGCVAKIFIDGNCLYQYSGHCSISVPFTASDFSSYMNAMLQVSALAVGAIAAGTGAALAAGAGAEAEAVAQQTSRTVKHTVQTKTVRNPDTGRQITAGTITTHQTIDRPVDQDSTEASFNGLSPQNIFNTASSVMASKAGISHAGSFNGNTGYLGVRYPFLVITTPRQCLPSSFQTMNGYPSMITLPLSECTGYTRVQQVQLTGMTATNPEQAEILQLLKEGVIL